MANLDSNSSWVWANIPDELKHPPKKSKQKHQTQPKKIKKTRAPNAATLSAVKAFLIEKRCLVMGTQSVKDIALAIHRCREWALPPCGITKNDARILVHQFANEEGLIRGVKHEQHPKPTPIKQIRDFYWSDEWRMVRYTALRRSRGVCELCGAAPEPGKPLHVDHIKPRSKYPELELRADNLQVLCADCNLGKGNRDEIDWRRNQTA